MSLHPHFWRHCFSSEVAQHKDTEPKKLGSISLEGEQCDCCQRMYIYTHMTKEQSFHELCEHVHAHMCVCVCFQSAVGDLPAYIKFYI